MTAVPEPGRELAGKVALVTGGASGIGRATVLRFARAGARVCVVDVDDANGAGVADETGGIFVHADVGNAAETDAAFARCSEELGPLDVAFLNAGITTGIADITELTDEAYRRIMRVNVDGVVFGVRAAARAMRDRGGAIVATASLAGLMDFPPDPIYTLTKHGVVGLVRSLAPTLSSLGITVNAVCPGMTDTNIMGPEARAAFRAAEFPLMPPEQIAEAVLGAVTGGGTGRAWVCQPGREPVDFEFRRVPGPRAAEAQGRIPPLLAERA
ncbi:MAG TPA: SDR family oxidoreductase [Acidimicrobiia bacterium]|nr:SDR family oxidoreductase [Acidimicrobiia bacterium]